MALTPEQLEKLSYIAYNAGESNPSSAWYLGRNIYDRNQYNTEVSNLSSTYLNFSPEIQQLLAPILGESAPLYTPPRDRGLTTSGPAHFDVGKAIDTLYPTLSGYIPTNVGHAILTTLLSEQFRNQPWVDFEKTFAFNPDAFDFKTALQNAGGGADYNFATGRTTPWTEADFRNLISQALGDPYNFMVGSEEAQSKNRGRLIDAYQRKVAELVQKQAASSTPLALFPSSFDSQDELIPAYDPTRVDARDSLQRSLGFALAGGLLGAGWTEALQAGAGAGASSIAASAPADYSGAVWGTAAEAPHLGALATGAIGSGIPTMVVTGAAPSVLGPVLAGGAAGAAAGGMDEMVVTGHQDRPPFLPALPALAAPAIIQPEISNPPPPEMPPVEGEGFDLSDITNLLSSGEMTIAPTGGTTNPSPQMVRKAGLPYDPKRFNLGATLFNNTLAPTNFLNSLGQSLSGGYNG